MSIMEAMKETIWLQGLLDNLEIDHDLLKINCNSMSAIYLVKTRCIMQGRSILMEGSTLFGRLLMKVIFNY